MFALNERIAADTVEIVRWPLCRVLLMNDSEYPWLILVPQRAELRELHDIAPEDQPQMMAEITGASKGLASVFEPDKINVSALGNIVPQLHVHIIARFATDASWPGPVRGKHPPLRYPPALLASTVERLREALR